ncbi:MAG: hypothetical protein ACREXP_20740 [Steroidobacteraceae bacterium]
MASDLRELVRVRELRERLAQNEASRLLEETAKAQAAVADARNHQELYIRQAAHASMLASGAAGQSEFSAADAHWLLDSAAGARVKAREAVALIRRAELVRQRAQEASDAASREYRRLALRHETVARRSQQVRREQLRRKLDREEETLIEEQATTAAALRANQAAAGIDEPRGGQ